MLINGIINQILYHFQNRYTNTLVIADAFPFGT